MSDRDWSKELAKIDRQLESISDDALLKPGPASAASSAAPAPVAKSGAQPKPTRALGAFLRLTLSVLLGVAVLFWPYQVRCGLGLATYLAAVSVVIASGVWSAVWTWRHRTGRGHSLSLLLILWGLLLASLEVLPRVGYAKPDAQHPSTWACH